MLFSIFSFSTPFLGKKSYFLCFYTLIIYSMYSILRCSPIFAITPAINHVIRTRLVREPRHENLRENVGYGRFRFFLQFFSTKNSLLGNKIKPGFKPVPNRFQKTDNYIYTYSNDRVFVVFSIFMFFNSIFGKSLIFVFLHINYLLNV